MVERDQIFAATAQERRRIADFIDELDAAQLATPSLCTGWDVKTVAAHWRAIWPKAVSGLVG